MTQETSELRPKTHSIDLQSLQAALEIAPPRCTSFTRLKGCGLTFLSTGVVSRVRLLTHRCSPLCFMVIRGQAISTDVPSNDAVAVAVDEAGVAQDVGGSVT